MSAETGFWISLAFLTSGVAVLVWLKVLTAWRQYELMTASHMPQSATSPKTQLDFTPVAGAGVAMEHPPEDLLVTMRTMQEADPKGRYRFPMGWCVSGEQAALAQAAFVGDVNHVLLTAQSDGGKDNWMIGVMLSLALLQSPRKVQFMIIDGKGLDFAGWENKAHTWRLALDPKEIAPAMEALTAERERRGRILRAARVSKWDNYQGGDLPLLVVYISELSLLQDAVGKTDLESWLNSELAAGRSFGIRFVVATQTASNFSTRWRSQIGLYVAGFQPTSSQDEPNTGLSSKEIRAIGAVPPSDLPNPPAGAGVFCIVFGRMAVNARAPFINDEQRATLLAALPDLATLPAMPKVASAHSNAVEAVTTPLPRMEENSQNRTLGKHGSAEALGITPEERAQIIEAARVESSRRKVALRVFSSAGGRNYDKVKVVCDEEGLLVAEPLAAELQISPSA